MKKDNPPIEPVETIIEPSRDFFKIPWKEISHYRDLLFLLVRRDFVAKYKQTILGPLWFILQPLLTTLVFTVIFGHFARIPTNEIPPVLFYLCGLLAWDYFAQCFSGISYSLVTNLNLFSKVYFPRLIIPFSILLSNLMRSGLQLGIFLCFYFYFKLMTPASAVIHPGAWLLVLPAAWFVSAMASLGAGLLVSALTVKYRDLQHMISFSIQLWMYGTPIIYPLAVVPERWKGLMLLNPMTEVVEVYRLAFFGSGLLSFQGIALSAGITAALFLSGLYMFNKSQRTFVDTI